MTAGTAIANGTGIPAVSRPRNNIVTMMIWSSGPMRSRGQRSITPDMGEEGSDDREAQRRDTDGHGEARNPERRFQERRCPLAETIGRKLEPDEVPQQDAGKAERQDIEDRRR